MAIHVLDEADRCLGCKNPQCRKGCPISTPIPTAIKLLREGRVDEAGALAALKKGDENALTWFMERYAAYAAAIINGIMLPRLTPADAEEALADVFVSLWRRAAERDSPGGSLQRLRLAARRG